jgi:hypothetical protein
MSWEVGFLEMFGDGIGVVGSRKGKQLPPGGTVCVVHETRTVLASIAGFRASIGAWICFHLRRLFALASMLSVLGIDSHSTMESPRAQRHRSVWADGRKEGRSDVGR